MGAAPELAPEISDTNVASKVTRGRGGWDPGLEEDTEEEIRERILAVEKFIMSEEGSPPMTPTPGRPKRDILAEGKPDSLILLVS